MATSGGLGTPTGLSFPAWRSHAQYSLEASESVLGAVACIERWWIRVRGRRIFKILKETVCSAEHSLTYEVLRRLSPLEAELLKDPTINARIKFRFCGPQFPPLILFKIFTSTQNARHGGVCYMSGKKMIKPASEAAEDARRQMGNRVFYDQLVRDTSRHKVLGVTDEMDVATMKEYMQYVSNMDETPADLGGKDNTWRRLTLTALPRHSALASLVGCLEEGGRESLGRLRTALTGHHSQSVSKPISSLSSRPKVTSRASTTPSWSSKRDGRQSRKQAKQRADKMRKLYSSTPEDTEAANKESDDDAWEDDVDDLYQWTQTLSFEDVT